MTYIRLMFLTLQNRMLEEIRYPFQFIFNSGFFIGIAYLLSLGGVALQGNTSPTSIDENIAAFFLAFLAGGGLNQPIETLDKSKIEEFYLQPLSSMGYIVSIALGRAIETVVTLSIFAGIVAFLRSSNLESTLRIAIIGLPVFLGMLGIGFGLAGLRMVFQKVGSLPQLLWVVLMGVAIGATPSSLQTWVNWSPFAAGLNYLRTGNMNIVSFSITILVSICVGAIIFYWGEQTMLKKGLISQE